MEQNPVLTAAQCTPTGGTYTVRVSWQIIQGATYFVAAVFDPQNNQVAHTVAGGLYGATTAMMLNVTLAASTSYTVRVAQSDQAGNPTSSYSQPFNVLQGTLTAIGVVNDLTDVVVSATLPTVGSPIGISAALLNSAGTEIVAASIDGTSGILVPPDPLDPAKAYSVHLAPSSNGGFSTGGYQSVNLLMTRPAISAIAYDGTTMAMSSTTTLPAGAVLGGTVLADDDPVGAATGTTTQVSVALASSALDLSKRYRCVLRAVNGGNAGPASTRVDAVVVAPQFQSAYCVGGHVGATWTVPPVGPVPTGAQITAVVDGTAGTPQTTIGYSGDIDISQASITTSLAFRARSAFGVALGPQASVTLAYTTPAISSVTVGGGAITAVWTNSGTAPGYRLYLNDANGNPVGFADTTDVTAALAPPVASGAAYSVSVQPFGTTGGIALRGPMSTTVAALVAAPVTTTTSYDGAKVTVNWTAPSQTVGITNYQAVLLHADTLAPTGASATVGSGVTSCDVTAVLDANSRVVAAVRATASLTSGALGPAVAVLSAKPAIAAADASATSLHVAWTAVGDATVTGYTVTISDGGSTSSTFDTTGTVLDADNSLAASQVEVRVKAKGASATGPNSDQANLFGSDPSFYPQSANANGLYLIRSSTNQPAPVDIVFAFPNVFTSTPSTLPSAGIFTLVANSASTLLPYKLTVAANSVAWQFDPASRATLASNFVDFLKKMEMPDGSTVLIQPGALTAVRQSLALGLPLLFSEQLKFMYGFDPDAQTGGFVDLVPGMRLRLDTEIQQITPPNNNQMGNVPSGTATYDIQTYPQGTALDTGFNAFLSAMGRPTVPTPLLQPNAGGGGVIDLYNAAGRQPYFRLLYPSAVKDPKYSSLVDQSSLPVILGAATYNGLLTATDRYVATGAFTGLTNIYPFYFRGRATLTPEVSANLNGQRHWLALGSTVENLIALAGAQPYCVGASVGGFRMRRSVAGLTGTLDASAIKTTAVVTNRVRLEYPAATFAPTQPGFFGLPLFCGDDITVDQPDPV